MSVRLKPLAEQVVVLTGASSGIGLATARHFAERGVKGLVLVARNEEALRDVAGELSRGGTRAVAVAAEPDGRSPGAVRACIRFGWGRAARRRHRGATRNRCAGGRRRPGGAPPEARRMILRQLILGQLFALTHAYRDSSRTVQQGRTWGAP